MKSLLAGLLGLLLCAAAAAGELAFAGAEGFGAGAKGGLGGREFVVTTLDDYLPGEEPVIEGSLRAAVEAQGPRMVRFAVGGTILLKAALRVREPFLTIDGGDAPAPGVTLVQHGMSVSDTHDIVVRHLRVRPGERSGGEVDAISIGAAHDVIIDHCSASWSVDEVLSVSGEGADNVTVQWCIISESLHRSIHKKGPHGMGSLVRANGRVSYHHNLYAHNNSRNPRPGTYGEPAILFDFRNNVIYNWGDRAGYSAADSVRMNYVGNFLLAGPSSKNRRCGFQVGGAGTEIYQQDSVLLDDGVQVEGWDVVEKLLPENRREEPFPFAPVNTTTAEAARDAVLAGAGATLPARDAVDLRIVTDVRAGTGRIIDSTDDLADVPAP